MQNSDASHFHWLPKCHALEGGFVNFRRLESVAWNELETKFDRENTRIAPSFVKDIVSRFSTFYARQGQPDIVASGGW